MFAEQETPRPRLPGLPFTTVAGPLPIVGRQPPGPPMSVLTKITLSPPPGGAGFLRAGGGPGEGREERAGAGGSCPRAGVMAGGALGTVAAGSP